MTGRSGCLDVPGARIYYKVQGSGPLLLLLSPGAGDADTYDALAGCLADRYTIVTCDRRGYARSPLDDPEAAFGIETHSDDASRLIAELSTEPADVFGSSIAALVALDLGLRHPEQVRTLVAHEPPLEQLLDQSERPRENLLELYRQNGSASAIRQFGTSIGVAQAGGGDLGLPTATAARAAQNREAFFRTDAGAVARYRLDVDALSRVSCRITVAAGRDGRAYFPYVCAARLAERLDVPLIEFPGTHAGPFTHPAEFATELRTVLG